MFSIIIMETKEFLRNKASLFFYILFPVLLIFLLGNLLSSIDRAEEVIGDIKIQYLINTDDPFQRTAAESFIKEAGKSNSMLQFVKADNLNSAKELAGKDEITAAAVFMGNPMEIKIYEGTNEIKNRAVRAVFHGFIQTDKAIAAVVLANPQILSGLSKEPSEFTELKDLGTKRSMMDYYAVTMLAMICFMSMLQGANAFMGERKNKTINRLVIAPQNRVMLFLQKILGMLPPVLLQILIIMVISVLLFKANYAATFQGNILLFIMFLIVTLGSISIGAVIGMIVKKNPMISIFPIVWTMMFFGGTNSKELYVKGVSEVMPIFQVQQAAFDLTVFGKPERINYVIVIGLLTIVSALALGAVIFSRKEEER